jgi:hypothetical protein
MSTIEGKGNIVKDGLMLYLDAANTKSYPGSGTIWLDLSKNNNNGNLINGPTFSNNNYGRINFDGVNDGVNLGSSSSLQFSTKMSICVVVRQNSFSSTGLRLNTIVGRWGNNTNSFAHNYYLHYNSAGRLSFSFKENATTNYLTSSLNFIPILGQIYYITLTYDTTQSKKFYINGVLNNSYFSDQITNQVMTTSVNTLVSVSSNLNESAFYSNNNIYLLKIYNRALTENEVQENFNSVKQRFNL